MKIKHLTPEVEYAVVEEAESTTERHVPTTTIKTSSTTTGVTEEDNSNSWLLPVLISVGGLLVIAIVGFIIFRKYKCFGLIERKTVKLAYPIIRRFSGVSTTSSTASNASSVGERRRYRKYLIRLANEPNKNVDVSRNIKAEFEALKREDPKRLPCTVALHAENILKNRFSNVLPYDRNRFLLNVEDGSSNDYINASFLTGYVGNKDFICTQGPKANTVDDFWRMCWESEAPAIVMLTRCYENEKEKCFPYWPTSLVTSFGSDIKVSLDKLSAFRLESEEGPHIWLVSELRMGKGDEHRSITQFVFLTWPDFGVIEPAIALISFINHFRTVIPPEKNPILVHCSAGIGRTGVFIAVDYLFQHFKASQMSPENVNVFQIVQRMRSERMGMVQTVEQYTLIYNCLKELIGNSSIPEPKQVSPDLIQISGWGQDSDRKISSNC